MARKGQRQVKKMTRLEDPMWKRRMVARDTLVGQPPGPGYPYELYKRNLQKAKLPIPSEDTMLRDMTWAREAILAMPDVKDVKSWLTNLMMFTTSKAYTEGQMNNAISAAKLTAELTGALAPQVVEDNSVNIAAYLAGSTDEDEREIIDAEQGGESRIEANIGSDIELGL